MSDQKVVAITGASNGMGYEAAKVFASRGWRVFAGARRVEKIPTDAGITAVKLDVTDSASNQAFIQQILQATGRIDVLVNNAGYGEYGPTEEIPLDKAKKQFDTNYFGAVELTNLVLPTMRQQAFGRIVNISSIGGNVYSPLGAHYYATKAALQQWSDSLDLEVAQFGICSVIIQPGGTQSSWGAIAFANAQKNLAPDSPYQKMVAAMSSAMGDGGKSFGGPTSHDLALDFYRAATDRKPKLRYFHSAGDRLLVHVAKAHPNLYKTGLKALMKHLLK